MVAILARVVLMVVGIPGFTYIDPIQIQLFMYVKIPVPWMLWVWHVFIINLLEWGTLTSLDRNAG